MADEMTDFLWRVSSAGYAWGDFEAAPHLTRYGAKGKIRVLTDAVPSDGKNTFERYAPLLECSGLFRTFALDTKPTEEHIQSFAGKYGTLGFHSPILVSQSSRRANLGVGETRESWANEIVDMRLAVNLWDAARARQYRELVV